MIVMIFSIVKRKKGKKNKDVIFEIEELGDTGRNTKLKPGINEKPAKKAESVVKVGAVKQIPSQAKQITETKQGYFDKEINAYRAALEQELADGEIAAGEENLLKVLRSKYNISDDEHKMIEVQIKLEKGAKPNGRN